MGVLIELCLFMHQNLSKTQEKHGKRRYGPGFGVLKTQTLVEIYNAHLKEKRVLSLSHTHTRCS